MFVRFTSLACAALALAACATDEPVNPVPSGSTAAQTPGPGGGGTTSSGGGRGAAGPGGSGATGAGGGGAGGVAGAGAGGGAAGAGGTGVGGGGSGSGGGLNADCTWGMACAAGLFCDAPGCGAGTCKKKPNPAAEKKDLDPICGCDHVTYWNQNIAELHGVPMATPGTCGAGALVCSSAAPCPSGTFCNEQVAAAQDCPLDSGTCWGVPVACGLGGPMARACTNSVCELQCSLIQSNHAWYDDLTCP